MFGNETLTCPYCSYDILYNSRTYTLLANPDSGLQLQSDAYILADLLHELEA
ncbi:hypothetical protein SAMN04487901_11146 [Prevotella communis]|uniref:Uncharacterized protein n=1 Tax=Prevotella communis TaxID=2913614 RepID=A0A1G7XRS8_9BACT|nr:hypothetical protein [Prevotella communis]SDG86420.1 hypothetical protein SAMN04487901_11146 [Prevotella communis]